MRIIYLIILLLSAGFFIPTVNSAQNPGSGQLAAAGALFCLSRYGYPNLCPKSANDSQSLMKLAQLLASPISMADGLDVGQSSAFPLQGIERYIRNCGYTSGHLKFQGVRPCPEPYSAGLVPDLSWIGQATRQRAAGCLLIGWYDHDAVKNLYKRSGGQWVTILGWQRNTSGRGNPISIMVSNPSSGQPANLYFEKITSGNLLQSTKNGQTLTVTQSAAGLYEVSSSLHGGGVSILDGAILIQM